MQGSSEKENIKRWKIILQHFELKVAIAEEPNRSIK